MTDTLSIQVSRYSNDYELEDDSGRVVAKVALGSIRQCPDPIRRAWSHLEAKWGMQRTQEPTVNQDPCPPETLNGFGWPFRSWVGPWMRQRGESL